MIQDESLWRASEARFEKLLAERGKTIKALRAGVKSAIDVEDAKRVVARFERLGVRNPGQVVKKGKIDPEKLTVLRGRVAEDTRVALERIMGANDMTPVHFLDAGRRAATSIARVRIRDAGGRSLGYGTGFLVSPRLFITNNHVLESASSARQSDIEFDFEEGLDRRMRATTVFRLEPQQFFLTDAALDYTLVAVRAKSMAGRDLRDFGWLKLIGETGKVLEGEYVNIIQHPNGQPKQLALRENQLIAIKDDFIHYVTDTAPGSSGSPVFSDGWEVVGLHHAGVPKRDKKGRILTVDGQLWRQGLEPAWQANEGIRVSRIVAHARGAAKAPGLRELVNQMLTLDPPLRPAAGALPSQASSVEAGGGGGPVVTPAGPGQYDVTIPLQMRLSVPQAPKEPEEPEKPKEPPGEDDTGSKDYYDPEADKAARKAYYTGIDKAADPKALFRSLSALVRETHSVRLSYREARHEHLYPKVDLHPDGRLRSLYSGDGFSVEAILQSELALEAELERRWAAVLAAENLQDPAELARRHEMLEAELTFNCEHVVPQSWFDRQQPMRADMHHLFTCEPRCNSFRGNSPYHDYEDFGEAVRSDCGKSEASGFEPEQGKGASARATLYFLLRYPGEIARSSATMTKSRISLLLSWHKNEPPEQSPWERHRNAEIFAVQRNRNPLIDLPELAEKIDFSLGLAGG